MDFLVVEKRERSRGPTISASRQMTAAAPLLVGAAEGLSSVAAICQVLELPTGTAAYLSNERGSLDFSLFFFHFFPSFFFPLTPSPIFPGITNLI